MRPTPLLEQAPRPRFDRHLSCRDRWQLIDQITAAQQGDVVVLHVGRCHPFFLDLDLGGLQFPLITPAIQAAVRRGVWVGFYGDPAIEARWYRRFARWRHAPVRATTW